MKMYKQNTNVEQKIKLNWFHQEKEGCKQIE